MWTRLLTVICVAALLVGGHVTMSGNAFGATQGVPTSCSNGANATSLCDATNTGIVGAGISAASLTSQGSITYTTANSGQTISGLKFTDTVVIDGTDNFTIDGCLFEFSGDVDRVLQITNAGSNNITIRNSTFRTTAVNGDGATYAIVQFGSATGFVIEKNDIGFAENALGINDSNAGFIVRHNFMHDIQNLGADHLDTIEIYGGSNGLVEHNTILMAQQQVAPINIAPGGSNTVTDLTIQDNFIDQGQGHFTIDNQGAGIRRTRIKRNRFGGHGGGGVWTAFLVGLLYDTGRNLVETEAALVTDPVDVLFPTSGPDLNYFYYCCARAPSPFGLPSLSPDRTNQTARSANWLRGSGGPP